MNYEIISRARKYLIRFDEILNSMSSQMLSPNITNEITINFIECMIPHHQAAIYMSENLLDYTKYKPLQDIANNIIKTQTKGIEQMKQVYRTTYGYINTKKDVDSYMTKYLAITKNMISRMRNSLRYPNINLDFISEMIPHHEGAIEMSNNLLQYYTDPRLVNMAKSIVKEQTEGVKQLESIRRNLRR